MVQPLQLPDIPPEGPWSAYVLVIIWLPLLFRIFFLFVPFRRAITRLAPHTKWALKALRDLPIRGIGLLAANEIIAFIIPPLVVLTLRMFVDPIGWQTWGEVSSIGLVLLIFIFMIWIILDFFRIARVRKMMKAIEKHDTLIIKQIHWLTIKRNLLSRRRNYRRLVKTPRKPDHGFQFQPSCH